MRNIYKQMIELNI